MKEYIERDKAVSVSYRYCHTVDGRCCGPDDVVELYEELKAIPAADCVPWEWLKRYAHGNGMQDASTFILEAMEAWENEQDVH